MDIIKIDYTLPKVKFTKEQLAEQVKEQIDYVKNNVDLDTKKALSETRKVIKQYDDQRKDITREWDTVKKTFMSDVKDALDYAISFETTLKDELDNIEIERKIAKMEEIKQLDGFTRFSEHFQDDSKWLNATYGCDKIQLEINEALEKLDNDIALIERTAKHHNINAKSYIDQLKRKDVNDIMDEMLRATESTIEPIVDDSGPKGTFTVKLTATKSQREQLKVFMNKIGIDWEVL